MRKTKYFYRGLVLAAALWMAPMSGQATLLGGCTFNDLSGVTVTSCSGFWSGNILSNSPAHVAEMQIALAALGVVNPTGAWLEKIDDNGGALTVDFSTLLVGPTIVAIHFGGGATPAAGGGKIFAPGTGGGTSFYLFDAGAGVDSFGLNLTASSGAALFQTMTSAVPEPEIYAMMVAGLGVLGFMARRKRKAA